MRMPRLNATLSHPEDVFCIASAGCTAMALAPRHEVVAVDIDPIQLAYAGQRFAGRRCERGAAEGLSRLPRLAPFVGGRYPDCRPA